MTINVEINLATYTADAVNEVQSDQLPSTASAVNYDNWDRSAVNQE